LIERKKRLFIEFMFVENKLHFFVKTWRKIAFNPSQGLEYEADNMMFSGNATQMVK